MRSLYLILTLILFAHSGVDARSCLQSQLLLLDDDRAARYLKGVSPDELNPDLVKAKRLFPSQLAYSRLKPLEGRLMDEVEQKLKSMKIVDKKAMSEGTANKVFEITLEDGTRAIWKPHTETMYSNYRTEVLAYEYDRKFGFKLVPPTVERTIDGQRGSVQLFMQRGNQMQYDGYEEAKQFFFDFLIENGDRHGKNWFVGADQRLVSIDNGVSFHRYGDHLQPWRDVKKIIGQFLKTEDGALYIQKLRETDLVKFKAELSDYIGSSAAEQAVERIRFIIKYNDEVLNPVPPI